MSVAVTVTRVRSTKATYESLPPVQMQKYQSKYEMSGISEGKVLQYALILATVQCLEIHHILLLLLLHITN